MGRTETVRHGPRLIDLDILFYDDLIVDEEGLTLPHVRMAERGFVLQPLMDLVPNLCHPRLKQTVRELHAALGELPLPRVLPVGKQLFRRPGPTKVVGILNVTPDSFSNDGLLASGAVSGAEQVVYRAVVQAERMVSEGADIIDVGGQSTRPGHVLVSKEEEIERIVPVVEALVREVDRPISVDTFRSGVARAALDAGATAINDVWGLRYDASLAMLAAERNVPLIVMHNHQQQNDPSYAKRIGPHPIDRGPDPVRATLDELLKQLRFAESRGVPRWLLVADPGMGFGKTIAEHMALTRRLNELTEPGYPLLFGPSRKGFVGKLLGDLCAEERDVGSATLCALAAERGAAMVRTHNVRMAVHAVRMADAVMGRTGNRLKQHE